MRKACQLRLRFLKDGAIALGPGKIELLEAVGEQGSISEAARHLGMSYRRAWQLIDTMNRCFPAPLVETSKGGDKGGGAVLSAAGLRVLALYRGIEAKMRGAAGAEIAEILRLLEAGPDDPGPP